MKLAEWSPTVDISEDDREYLVKAELPEGVSGEKVKAEFKEGLLTVHLPKSPPAKAKTTAVKIE